MKDKLIKKLEYRIEVLVREAYCKNDENAVPHLKRADLLSKWIQKNFVPKQSQ